jgi:hypothetical protein
MASNNTYKVEFKADIKQFATQIDQAGNKFHKFSGSLNTGVRQV